MNGKNLKIGVMLVMVLLMILASFSVLASNASASSIKAENINEDTLIVAIREDIESLNMFDPGSYLAVKTGALAWCYDTLMGYTPDLIAYLNMAENYTVDTPDGLNVTVHLRKGIKFHDGVEMTADDVVFTYQTLAYNPLYSNNLESLIWPDARWKLYDGNGISHVGVEKIDDYTVAFHLYQPYPLLYHVVLNQPIMPLHIWKDHVKSAGTGDSDDVILDYSYGNNPSEGAAAMGTGPFKFTEWKIGAYVVFDRNEDYWGKDFTVRWEGKNWPIYPQHVRRLVFKVYNSADTSILALRKGEVHLADVLVGYYKSLKLDPNIGIEIIQGDNFYFMPFNMRRSPMDDLSFRKAVAHTIDRDYIVTTLSQGFATKGTVPIAIISGAYINTSAVPPDFDLNAASRIFDQAGYVDVNGDGWREAPGGKPLKLSILSPTKDYSPIMADIGIIIQNNLRRAGINIINTPLDFGTLVSKMIIQVDFDMLVMGYSTGSPFPETYLKMFFYSKYASPVGNNMAGYSNPKVDKLLDEIDHEMDTQKRIKLIKDLQGILMQDLPWVTLCYRKFLTGYRKDIWQGWVPAYAGIMNIFSIGQLHHPGGGEKPHVAVSEISSAYNGAVLHVYLPDAAYAGREIKGVAYVTDINDVPIPNVKVTITATNGFIYNGTTGSDGGIQFEIPLAFHLYDEPVKVTYSMAAIIGNEYYNYTGSKDVKVYLPKNAVRLSLNIDKNILSPGESATIKATVTDLFGNPLKDVNVTILTEETSGSIQPYAQTDANGVATFTYTAPPTIVNMNLMDVVKAQIKINDTILSELQSAELYIPIQTSGSSWYKVSIESVSAYGLTAGQSTDIKVKVVDNNGDPVADHDVYIEAIYSNGAVNIDTTNVQFDADHKTTDSNGEVTFTMTAVNNINRPYIVRTYTKDTYSAFDSVEIYVGNATGSDPSTGPWSVNYGMDLSISPSTVKGCDEINVKVKVYNTDGTPAANVSGFFGLFATNYGPGAAWPDDEHRIYNPFLGDYYSFTTDSNGEATVIATTNLLIGDQAVYVDAWVDPGTGIGLWLGATLEYPMLFGVKEGFILERVPIMGISEFTVDKPYFTDEDLSANVTIKVVDVSGPLENANLQVSWSIGIYSSSTMVTTGSDGTAAFTAGIASQMNDGIVKFTVRLSSGDHTIGDNKYEFLVPYLSQVGEMSSMVILKDISIEPSEVQANGTATITLSFIGGLTGKPLANREIKITPGSGYIDVDTKKTDSEGKVSFAYRAPNSLVSSLCSASVLVDGEKEFFIAFSVKGKYANMGELQKELNKVPKLTNELNELQKKYDDLNKSYKELKEEKESATNMEYVFLGLFVIFLVLSPVMYMVGKKQGVSKAVKEEEPSEELSEEEGEEIEEESSNEEEPEE